MYTIKNSKNQYCVYQEHMGLTKLYKEFYWTDDITKATISKQIPEWVKILGTLTRVKVVEC